MKHIQAIQTQRSAGYREHKKRQELLCNIGQVVLNFSRRKAAETLGIADTDLNVVTAHLSLKALLQC